MQEIHLQFPKPGEWDKFTMTAVYRDADDYTHTDHYTQDDIPADQAPALAAVVTALVGLAAPWQASQVWARLDQVTTFPPADGDVPAEFVVTDVVRLAVEAVNAQGGRRTFVSSYYPAFVISDPAAVAFFKHFTNQ